MYENDGVLDFCWMQHPDNPLQVTYHNTTFVIADFDNDKGASNDLISKKTKELSATLASRAPEMLTTLYLLKDVLLEKESADGWPILLLMNSLQEFDLISEEERKALSDKEMALNEKYL